MTTAITAATATLMGMIRDRTFPDDWIRMRRLASTE